MPSAAILAGGQARRFGGCDKGSLLLDGVSIFERQLRVLSQITDEILVVGCRPVAAAPPRPSWLPGEVAMRLVADRVGGLGPLAGVDAALAAARDDDVLVVAGDMPGVTAPFLRYLLSLTGDGDAIVPVTERGYHPLCAVYTRACRAAITRRLLGEQLSMVGLLEDLRVRAVREHEMDAFGGSSRLLANVNTPAELNRLETLLSHEL
jgi:molybdopterin-guanine dinucleotide biosynthesis protein A